LNVGEGLMVCSEGGGPFDRAALVPIDGATEFPSDVHDVDRTEVGSESLVHVVVCHGESSPVVDPE
jgi:hypothetical protein